MRPPGFSLLELAIVLTIVGTFAGGALVIANKKIEQNKYDLTQDRLDRIEKSLKAVASKAVMLPCPASPSAPLSSIDFGAADDCSLAAPTKPDIVALNAGTNEEIWIGTVPTRALNLADSDLFDGWGNRFRYAVVKNLAASSSQGTIFRSTLTTGVLQVVDQWGNQIPPASEDSVVAYVLVSYGKDAKGALSRSGLAAGPICPAASAVTGEENCDNDARFVDARYNDGVIAASQFDDLVRWKSWLLVKPVRAIKSPPRPAKFPTIYPSGEMTSIISTDGRLQTVGNNSDGEIGDGTKVNRTVYTSVTGSVTQWDIVNNDGDNTCGVSGGHLYCWGDNTYGQVGNGTSGTDVVVPTEVSGSYNDWEKLDVDDKHACGIRSGHLYCWGEGADYKLGTGTTANKNTPQEVLGNFSDWTDVAIAGYHTCGIRNDGAAYCWGSNTHGQLGNNGVTITSPLQPQAQVGTAGTSTLFTDWQTLASQDLTMCGIRKNGQLYCWGESTYGQIGNGTKGSDILVPTQVGAASDWEQISTGTLNVCGIRRGGYLYCWGRSGYVGDGSPFNSSGPSAGDRTTPVEIKPGTVWLQIGIQKGGCGIDILGKPYCWGDNSQYQLGDGTTTFRTSPVPVTTF